LARPKTAPAVILRSINQRVTELSADLARPIQQLNVSLLIKADQNLYIQAAPTEYSSQKGVIGAVPGSE
jgi:hypothetical protein